MICLPLFGFDVTRMLSIITTLIVICLIWENITSLMRGATVWEPWVDTDYPEDLDDARAPLLGIMS